MALHAPHPGHADDPPSATGRLLRWVEALVLLVAIALAMLGCQSGTATGGTVGKGLGACWGSITGEEGQTDAGQAMGRAVGGMIGSALGVEADRQMRQSRSDRYEW